MAVSFGHFGIEEILDVVEEILAYLELVLMEMLEDLVLKAIEGAFEIAS